MSDAGGPAMMERVAAPHLRRQPAARASDAMCACINA